MPNQNENQSPVKAGSELKGLVRHGNLKPCPFCGETPNDCEIWDDEDGFFHVMCPACGTLGPNRSKNQKGARKSWNKRA
jgi:Lar family restriction alleviation protein